LPNAMYVCFLAHSNNVCALSLIWKLVWKLSNFSSVAGILSSLYCLISRFIFFTICDLEVTFLFSNIIFLCLFVFNYFFLSFRCLFTSYIESVLVSIAIYKLHFYLPI